jgi:hypothetical protein
MDAGDSRGAVERYQLVELAHRSTERRGADRK